MGVLVSCNAASLGLCFVQPPGAGLAHVCVRGGWKNQELLSLCDMLPEVSGNESAKTYLLAF